MSHSARLTVDSGPDRGKAFDLTEELTLIGTAEDNHVVLTDGQLADLQASIVFRNGRFAICTPMDEGIEVEGNRIPADRWVWLPAEARIQLSKRTQVFFRCEEYADEDGAEPSEQETAPPAAEAVSRSEAKGSRAAAVPKAKRGGSEAGDSVADLPRPKRVPEPRGEKESKGEKKSKAVAKFITEGAGELLVKLGEDGHLPELALADGTEREERDVRPKQSSPLMLVAIICLSCSFSILVLLADIDTSPGNTRSKGVARQRIAEEYFGKETEDLQPYQIHLRRARQAFSRNDYAGERREYRRVLDMLYSEGKGSLRGVTGTTERDEELRQLIGTIMAE